MKAANGIIAVIFASNLKGVANNVSRSNVMHMSGKEYIVRMQVLCKRYS